MKMCLGYKLSFLWRSLLIARVLVLEDTLWRVGNRKEISIMDHRWIVTENPSKPRSTPLKKYRASTVEVLIDEERGWNRELINNIS